LEVFEVAVREILRMGHPLLLQVAQPVTDIGSTALDDLIRDLWETMAAANGAGLAAPQIGVLQRVVVFGGARNPRYPDKPPLPRTVLINPEIVPLANSTSEDWEGCLSVPGMRGWVQRFDKILYRWQDERGHWLEREVDGFHARVVQHECDHLDGVLYPRRIQDMTKFGFIQDHFPEGVRPSESS
jgi:peptide deformylase